MRFIFRKSMIALAIATLSFTTVYAQPKFNKEETEVFQTTCVKTWMQKAGDTKDKAAYQSFGEKYCKCAMTRPLDSDADIEKAAVFCVATTLLRDTMDTLEDNKELEGLTSDKVVATCQDKWAIVFPEKGSTKNFCQCAGPKLAAVNEAAPEDMSDTEWNSKIDKVAEDCAAGMSAKDNNS